MNIFVCIKQVPDTETKIKLKADNTGIETTGIKWVMNPYDEFAVEEALKLKEKNPSAMVTVLSVGPKTRVVESLRTALAMGADNAVVIDSPEDIDSNTTAQALAKAIQQEGSCDLILTGKLAIDDNMSAVSQLVAEYLKIPHTTVISKLQIEGNKVLAERDIEGGAKEIVEMTGPALVAANKGLNMPRYASLPGIMKAKKKVIKELSLNSLELGPTALKVRHKNFQLPADKSAVKMLDGDSAQQASQLVNLLRNEAKVI